MVYKILNPRTIDFFADFGYVFFLGKYVRKIIRATTCILRNVVFCLNAVILCFVLRKLKS